MGSRSISRARSGQVVAALRRSAHRVCARVGVNFELAFDVAKLGLNEPDRLFASSGLNVQSPACRYGS